MGASDPIGLDTGLFVRLLEGDAEVRELFERLLDPEVRVVVSCLTLYELRKLRHRGVIERTSADRLLEQITSAFEIVWIDDLDMLDRAAGLSHGQDLSMADAIILACCLGRSCEVFYTTDADFAVYESEDLEVVVLE